MCKSLVVVSNFKTELLTFFDTFYFEEKIQMHSHIVSPEFKPEAKVGSPIYINFNFIEKSKKRYIFVANVYQYRKNTSCSKIPLWVITSDSKQPNINTYWMHLKILPLFKYWELIRKCFTLLIFHEGNFSYEVQTNITKIPYF